MRKFEIFIAGCKPCYKSRLLADLKRIEPNIKVSFTGVQANMPYISVKRNFSTKGYNYFVDKNIYENTFLSRIPRVWKQKFSLVPRGKFELTRT